MSLDDVARKPSTNLDVSKQISKYSMIQTKSSMLINCLTQANFARFLHVTWKTAMNFV